MNPSIAPNLEKEKINKSLHSSYIQGIFASSMTGLTQDYFTPFLLLLNSSSKHVGFLNAFPNLFAALLQLKSPRLSEKFKSRKNVVNTLVFLQAVTLMLMCILAWLELKNPVAFIVLVIFFTAVAALANPAWASLMVDLVPQERRGEYFGWRNRNLGFIIVAATFLAGVTLHQMEKINVSQGFAIVFGVAGLCRFISWNFLRKMYDPPVSYGKEHQFTFWQFIRRLKKSNFAQFVFFVSMMSFSVNLAAPFFAVFMLNDLSFSYLLYTVANIFTTITLYSTMNRWGKHADKIGNLKVIRFTTPLIAMIPLFWILNQHPVYLFVIQLFSGFIWAGFNLCSSNFIYDAVSPEKRTRCVAYFNVLNGIALSCGAVLGGLILPLLPELGGYKILALFLLSALFRLLIALTLPSRIKEVRQVSHVRNSQLFFSMIGYKPILGIERKTIRFES